MRSKLLPSLRPSALAGLVLASSSMSCLEPDLDHCSHQPGELRGHAWCEERHPELPLCSRCEPAANGLDGCVADVPRLECLVGPPAAEAETSSGPPPDASTTAATTCNPADCAEESPSRPLCSDDDQCVPCSAAGGDEGCAATDPDRPACVTDGPLTGACVPCTDASFCPADAPICDADLHACTPCRFQAECLSAVGSACRIETGQCLPATLVRHVDASARPGGDGSADVPFSTIAQALNNPDLLDYGTIVIHDGEYAEASTIVDGRVIALVAAPGQRPRISGDATSGLVAATGLSTELYLDGLTLLDNREGAGLRVESRAIAYVDRTELLQNAIGIELTSGGHLTLRNSIVTTRLSASAALSIADEATADITYSTLFNTATGGVETILCTPPVMAVTVRNSIILARDTSEASGWSCAAGTVGHSAGENIPADGTADNLLVCGHPDVDCGIDLIMALFTGSTNLRLNETGIEVFRDVPSPSAEDPAFDIDGNPRTPDRDFAGASAPASR